MKNSMDGIDLGSKVKILSLRDTDPNDRVISSVGTVIEIDRGDAYRPIGVRVSPEAFTFWPTEWELITTSADAKVVIPLSEFDGISASFVDFSEIATILKRNGVEVTF